MSVSQTHFPGDGDSTVSWVSTSDTDAPWDDVGWDHSSNIGSENGNGQKSPNEAGYQHITVDAFDTNVYSKRTRAKRFGFTLIPEDDIVGIEIAVKCWCPSGKGSAVFDLMQLTVSGLRVGNNLAASTVFPTTEGWLTFGGPTELWGYNLPWTPAVIDDDYFGVDYAAKATSDNTDIYVDCVKITVYYDAGIPFTYQWDDSPWKDKEPYTVNDDGAGIVTAENSVLKVEWRYADVDANGRSGGAVYGLWDKTTDPDCENNMVQEFPEADDAWSPSRAGVGGLGTAKAYICADIFYYSSKAVSENGSRGTLSDYSVSGTNPVVFSSTYSVRDAIPGRLWTHYWITKEWTLDTDGKLTLNVTYELAENVEQVTTSSLTADATTMTVGAGQGDLLGYPDEGYAYVWAGILTSDAKTHKESIYITGRTGADTFTIVRGALGTTPYTHDEGASWSVSGAYMNDPNMNFSISRDYGFNRLAWVRHNWDLTDCGGVGSDGASNPYNETFVDRACGIGTECYEYHQDAFGGYEDYGTKHVQEYRAEESSTSRAIRLRINPYAGGYESTGMFEMAYDAWSPWTATPTEEITGELSTYMKPGIAYGHACRFGSWWSGDGDQVRYVPVAYTTTWNDTYVIDLSSTETRPATVGGRKHMHRHRINAGRSPARIAVRRNSINAGRSA